jgi:hypothetical protein
MVHRPDFDQILALGNAFGDGAFERDAQQDGQAVGVAESIQVWIRIVVTVDDHPRGNAQFTGHFRRQPQVVQSKGGRFGDQQEIVRAAHGCHDRAGGARRGIQDDGLAGLGRDLFLEFPDDGDRHWLANIQQAAPEVDAFQGRPALDDANRIQCFRDRFFRAQGRAGATSVTQLREDQRFLPEHGDGVIGAHFGAFATKGTKRFVYHRDHDPDRLALFQARFQEQVGVGRLHITVYEDGRWGRTVTSQAESQAGSNRGFSGAALAAGDYDAHVSGGMPTVAFLARRCNDAFQSAGPEAFDRFPGRTTITVNVHGNSCRLQGGKGVRAEIAAQGRLSFLIGDELGSLDTRPS